MITQQFTAAVNMEARLAALFVQNASKFQSRLLIRRDNMEVNCKSIMGIVSMSINKGDIVTVTGIGADESEAVKTLMKMLESRE